MRMKMLYTALVLIVSAATLIMAAAQRRGRVPQPPKAALTQLNLAHYLPSDCFLYIQFRDLATQMQSWRNSQLQARYYQSKSFEMFARRHLSLKLSERLMEFESSLGYGMGLDVVPAQQNQEAAIAVYDIGGTQFVFITEIDSPAWFNKWLATNLHNDETFSAVNHNGQQYYRSVSGGSIQLCYALVNKQLIVATREALLLDTLKTINGQQQRLDSLPELQQLIADAKEFHDITLWLDQARINQDWYFRHYWIHKNFDELKPFRSGLVDLEMKNEAWVERRFFTLNDTIQRDTAVVASADLQQLTTAVPSSVAAYRIEAVNSATEKDNRLFAIVNNVLFQPSAPLTAPGEEQVASRYAYSGDEYDFSYTREYGDDSNDDFSADNYFIYTNLTDDDRHYGRTSSLYNVEIDNPLTSGMGERAAFQQQQLQLAARDQALADRLRQSLIKANPRAIARFSEPNSEAGDLFVSFDHAAVIVLKDVAALDRAGLEQALLAALRANLVTSANPIKLEWQSRNLVNGELRVLALPLLGRGIAYAVKGDLLIISNRPEYAARLLQSSGQSPVFARAQLSNFSIVKPQQGRKAFLRIFNQLDKDDRQLIQADPKHIYREDENNQTLFENSDGELSAEKPKDKLAEAFFSGNLASLFNVISNVSEVTFESEWQGNRLQETVQYRLQTGRALATKNTKNTK